jgi:hypothetical protein
MKEVTLQERKQERMYRTATMVTATKLNLRLKEGHGYRAWCRQVMNLGKCLWWLHIPLYQC